MTQSHISSTSIDGGKLETSGSIRSAYFQKDAYRQGCQSKMKLWAQLITVYEVLTWLKLDRYTQFDQNLYWLLEELYAYLLYTRDTIKP